MIVLMDRGYHARDLIGSLRSNGISFVLRLSRGVHAWTEVAPVLSQRCADERLDVRTHDHRGRFSALRLRVLLTPRAKRGRPRCNRTPQQMILLTDLLTWKAASVVALYHRRWAVETVFRENRRLLGAVRCRSRTKSALQVEIPAYAIYRLLMACAMAAASPWSSGYAWLHPRSRATHAHRP